MIKNQNNLTAVQKTAIISLAVFYPIHTSLSTPLGSINTSYADLFVFILFLFFVLGQIGEYKTPKYIIYILCFIGVAILSLFLPIVTSMDSSYINFSGGVFEIVKLVGAVMWSFTLFVLLRRNPVHGILIFSTFSVITAFIFATITMVQVFGPTSSRLSGPFQNPNLYANYLTMNLFLAILLSYSFNNNKKTAFGFIIPCFLFISIIYTGSRGGMIGLITGLGFMFLANIHKNNHIEFRNLLINKKTVFFVIVASLAFWFTWRTNPFVVDRILSTFDDGGRNFDTRIESYLLGIRTFIENPIFGVGYHQESSYIMVSYGVGVHSEMHNTYISILAGTGIIGFSCFIGLITHVFRTSMYTYLNKNKISIFILSAIIALLAQNLVTNGENFRSLWILIGLSTPLAYYYSDLSKKE